MVHETVVGKVGLEGGAREDINILTRTIKIGGDSIFMAQLSFHKVDVAKCGRARGQGDAEDDVVGKGGSLGGWVVVD